MRVLRGEGSREDRAPVDVHNEARVVNTAVLVGEQARRLRVGGAGHRHAGETSDGPEQTNGAGRRW